MTHICEMCEPGSVHREGCMLLKDTDRIVWCTCGLQQEHGRAINRTTYGRPEPRVAEAKGFGSTPQGQDTHATDSGEAPVAGPTIGDSARTKRSK